MPIVLIGLGKVGGAFERQIRVTSETWRRKGVHIEIVATVRRAGVRLDAQGDYRPFEGWAELAALFAGHEPPPILVDASSGQTLDAHRAWIDRGWTVVTANKIPLADGGMDAHPLFAAAADPRGCRYWFEATVGAGMPIVSTLRELVATGDRWITVEATPSGTLNYLCFARASGIKLTEALRNAGERGLTEPDPRIDLRGTDVLRKGRILQYVLSGKNTEARHEPFLPDDTLEGSNWHEAAEKAFEERVRAAKRNDSALRYTLYVSKKLVQVRLEEVMPDGLFGSSKYAENVFVITSERYPQDAPLVIRGPGAGPDVTATALYGDVLASAGLL